MKTFIASLIISMAVTVGAYAGSRIDLTTPDQAKAGTTTYEIARIELHFPNEYVRVDLIGENGETRSIDYSGDGANTFFTDMALSDAAISGLRSYVLGRLVADGHLVGVVVND